SLWIGTRQGEGVGVTDAGRLDLDQYLALARSFDVDLFDAERFACGGSYCGPRLHGKQYEDGWVGTATLRKGKAPERRSAAFRQPRRPIAMTQDWRRTKGRM